MLLSTLRDGARAIQAWLRRRHQNECAYPLEEEEWLARTHGNAPLGQHLDILCGNAIVGEKDFPDLYIRCVRATGTQMTPVGMFRRCQSRFHLARYFLQSLTIDGARAEVGVYRGATALLLAHVARSRRPDDQGQNFYLIDSFEGTGVSRSEDWIPVRDARGGPSFQPFFPPGKSDTSAELVGSFFRDFPQVEIRKGWIPDVFSGLPDTRWAFVHLDVTLYAPTLAGLDYFYPRLASGGILVCDSYGSPFCPGLRRAWDEYCERHGIPFVVLGTRQSVVIKP